MLNIAHFIHIFIFAVGGVAIYIAFLLYKEYRLYYLRSHIYMLIGFCLLTFSNTIETFIKVTVSSDELSLASEHFSNIALFILPIILIFTTYHFVAVINGLLQKENSPLYKKLALAFVAFFIGARILPFIDSERFSDIPYILLIVVNMIFFARPAFLLSLSFLQSKVCRAGKEKRRFKFFHRVSFFLLQRYLLFR